MENVHFTKSVNSPFLFLEDSFVQEHFADLNIALLRGKHIQSDQFYLYKVLQQFTYGLRHYYKALYRLELVKETTNEGAFYYLDCPEDSRGKLNTLSRSKELTESQIILGIMLLNMYYDRYFEQTKEVKYENIEYEVMEGENSTLYRKLLFGEVRETYSDQEWKSPRTRIKNVLRDFEQLGWVQQLPTEADEETAYILRTSILRFQKLYEREIMHFEEFVESYHNSKNAHQIS